MQAAPLANGGYDPSNAAPSAGAYGQQQVNMGAAGVHLHARFFHDMMKLCLLGCKVLRFVFLSEAHGYLLAPFRV